MKDFKGTSGIFIPDLTGMVINATEDGVSHHPIGSVFAYTHKGITKEEAEANIKLFAGSKALAEACQMQQSALKRLISGQVVMNPGEIIAFADQALKKALD